MKIVQTDEDGKEGGGVMTVTKERWLLMQSQFGKNLRWKELKIKEKENDGKKRRATSDPVEKD